MKWEGYRVRSRRGCACELEASLARPALPRIVMASRDSACDIHSVQRTAVDIDVLCRLFSGVGGAGSAVGKFEAVHQVCLSPRGDVSPEQMKRPHCCETKDGNGGPGEQCTSIPNSYETLPGIVVKSSNHVNLPNLIPDSVLSSTTAAQHKLNKPLPKTRRLIVTPPLMLMT